MSLIYGIISLVSLILIVICRLVDKKNNKNLLLLFISVFVCNLGNFLISVSPSVGFELWANRISYLGQVFLPFFMLRLILELCKLDHPKWLTPTLLTLGSVMLLIAASPGICDLYYKNVSIETINGTTRIIRDYGILHDVYSVYLAGYVIATLGVIIYAIKKKKLVSTMHATFLFAATLCNVTVWIVEKFLPRGFEFLSVSYIVTELFILLLYGILQQYEMIFRTTKESDLEQMQIKDIPQGVMESLELFIERVPKLTDAEYGVFVHYVNGYKIKEIPSLSHISENTVKKYNRSIYKKLGVSTRDELMVYIDLLKRCDKINEVLIKEK